MTLPYGRSLKGERAYDSCPVSQGQRISTIGALSTEGLTAGMSYEGTLNGDIFLYFLENFLVPQLKSGDVVICDNASSHRACLNIQALWADAAYRSDLGTDDS